MERRPPAPPDPQVLPDPDAALAELHGARQAAERDVRGPSGPSRLKRVVVTAAAVPLPLGMLAVARTTPRQAPRVLTVRATATQLRGVRALLDRYERAESPACAAGAGAAR